MLAKCKKYGVDTTYCRIQTGLYRNSLAIAETKPQDAAVVIYRNDAADLQIAQQDIQRLDFSNAGGLIITGTALSDEPSASTVSVAIAAARRRDVRLLLILIIEPMPGQMPLPQPCAWNLNLQRQTFW